jgi:hypothetical protein
MVKMGRPRIATREKINQTIAEGARTRRELAEKLGVHYSTILKNLKEEGIDIPREATPRRGSVRIPARDKLLKKGHTQDYIGKKTGDITGERVRQYINSTGQQAKWKHYRGSHLQRLRARTQKIQKEELRRKQVLSNVVSTALEGALQNLGDDGLAARKALEYLYSRKSKSPNQKYNFEDLFVMFKRYFEARDRGDRLSLVQLTEGTNLWFSRAAEVLHKTGLEPMHERGKYDRSRFS